MTNAGRYIVAVVALFCGLVFGWPGNLLAQEPAARSAPQAAPPAASQAA